MYHGKFNERSSKMEDGMNEVYINGDVSVAVETDDKIAGGPDFMNMDENVSSAFCIKRKFEDMNGTHAEKSNGDLEGKYVTEPKTYKGKKKHRIHMKDNEIRSGKEGIQRKKPGRKPSNKSTLITKTATSSKPIDDNVLMQEDSWKNISSPEPEPDPEKSLDVFPEFDKNGISTGVATTVHWDPHSSAGQKVGCRVRVYQGYSNKWKCGRIVRYDPVSHKYKVDFTSEQPSTKKHPSYPREEWMDLKDYFVYISSRFVWALVKGYAWWPAQILTFESPIYPNQTQSSPIHPKNQNHGTSTLSRDIFSEPPRDGYLLVEFFDTGELAFVKDSPESIRPFHDYGYMDDPIMKKNKKRPSPTAIQLCKQEKSQVQHFRNSAAQFYARKAFAFVNKRASFLLGRKIKLFRGDLHYPQGEHVIGTIRQYSCASKKWLVIFDPWPTNKACYDPDWFNLLAKDLSYTFVDQLSKSTNGKYVYEPTELDLLPYLFGFVPDSSSDKQVSSITLCHGCLLPLSKSINQSSVLKCICCLGQFHPGCIDPMTLVRLSEANPDNWICHKCIPCVGCRQRDIGFGIKNITSPPPSLKLKFGESLDLCSTCTPLYESNMFCPVCAHVWDDVKFQKVQSRLLWNSKMNNPKFSSNKRFDLDLHEIALGDNPKIEWYYPETPVWGYTESTMIQCDMCNLWVHAGCAPLTKEEYEQTIEGSHPIYSKEYLCRVCCKKRCLALMEMLQKEDSLFLFANPVTDQMAHNYHDLIKHPMDLRTMNERVVRGDYCNYAWIRESFELMVYNALTFNRPFTKFWNEARRFYDTCIKKIFNDLGKAAPPSNHENLIHLCISKAYSAVQAEIDREQMDATAEKKDTLAGAQVVSVQIGPLNAPIDPKSWIAFTENRSSNIDAFFSCWMECCFICGSSGAMDTLLYCVDCGEAFHSFCCHVPIQSMTALSLLGWRCPNCKVCEISGLVPIDDSRLLMCEMCDRAFSIDLINPPLTSAPKGLWICGFCVDCKHCSNLSGIVDRTMWSMLPDTCYRCGGAALGSDGLFDAYKCSVCDMFSLPTDTRILTCSQCKRYIHETCADLGGPLSKGAQFRCSKCCQENSRLTPKEVTVTLSKEGAKPNDNCEDIDEFFPSDRVIRMTSQFCFRNPPLPMYDLHIMEYSAWYLKPRAYSSCKILEDALVLNQIICNRDDIRFQELVQEYLGEDTSPIIVKMYVKAVRFHRLLRNREKRRFRCKKKNLFTDKEVRSALTDMACSYICTACILFGIDSHRFFPFMNSTIETTAMGVPLSLEWKDEGSNEGLYLFRFAISTVNLSEDPSSMKTYHTISCAYSLMDFNPIAQVIAKLKPMDDLVETVAFNDAVFALFHMSHQSANTAEQTHKINPEIENKNANQHENNVVGIESSGVDDYKQVDDNFQVDEIEENSVVFTGLTHSGASSSPRPALNHTGEKVVNGIHHIDTISSKVFDPDFDGSDAAESLIYDISAKESNNLLLENPTTSLSDVAMSNEYSLTNISHGEVKRDEQRSSEIYHLRNTITEGIHSSVEGIPASTSNFEDACAERHSSLTNVMNSNVQGRTVSKIHPLIEPSLAIQSWKSAATVEVNPMVGWSSSHEGLGINIIEWKDSRMCCLCMTCGDDDADAAGDEDIFLVKSGRLLPLQGGWVHVQCALWSSEVWRNHSTGTFVNVHKARSRGLKLKCSGCGRVGATVGCNKIHCKSNYHFACAAACGAVFTNSNRVYCFRHRDVTKDGMQENFSEIMECLKVDQSDSSIVSESNETLPLRIGALTVHSFGLIDEDCDAFHSKYHLYPEGFTSSRIFWSSVEPKKRTLYIMNVSKSRNGKAFFSIRAADSTSILYKGTSLKKVYDDLIQQVLYINQAYFSVGEKDSIHPIHRSPKRRAYGLNGPQFFGFGLDCIRKILELSTGVASCAVPLSDKAEPYRFCFVNPAADDVTSIQRKRALLKAEKSLQNPSGCARAEGMNAFHKSGGSGRITRALVRRADDETTMPDLSSASGAISSNAPPTDDYNKKYQDLKAVPFEEKLVAKRSHIHGWGLFAKVSFPKHSMIIEYMGETIRQCISDKREREYEENGIGSCYMFRLDFERIVDATTIGCMARFMNHSCCPNCYAKVIQVTDDLGVSDNKIIIFASKEISAGDEITYDYKFPVEDGSLRCTCGAPNCIGRMN